MHPLEEKDDTPLLDADITRLIKLSREVGYKKQDNIPERNLVDFKPVSINKIASEASPKSNKVTTPNQMNDQERAQLEGAEAKNSDITKEKNDLNKETDVNRDKIEDKQDHEQIRKTVDAINLLINNIKAKETIDKSDLMNSITDVITNLASERAGLEIDKTPQVLKDKIVAFVDEIEHATKKIILNLHPKDAELIKQITKEAQLDQNIELKENSELFRGDYILQMGSIEMGNLISKQLHVSEPYREEIVEATLTDNGFNPEEGTKNFKELEDTPKDRVKTKKTAEKNGK